MRLRSINYTLSILHYSYFHLRQKLCHISSEEFQLPYERGADAAVSWIGEEQDGLYATQLSVDVSLLALVLEVLD